MGTFFKNPIELPSSHYYLRTPEYVPILERKRDKRGCFAVPMVHSSVLVDLGAEGAADLTFDPAKLKGWSGVPDDDIIAFALSAKSAGVPMHVCNEEKFGYIMTPLEAGEDLADDYVRLSDLRLQGGNSIDIFFGLSFSLKNHLSFGLRFSTLRKS